MPRFTLQQQYQRSCAAAASAVAVAELQNNAGLATNVQENLIYQQISRNYNVATPNNSDVSAPAKIVRYFKDAGGYRSSMIESPIRTVTILSAQFNVMFNEWKNYSGELWSWTNWIWRWPRGLRARDFDNNARVLMVCYRLNDNALHYLLARRDGGQYYIMDPAQNNDTQIPTFESWAGFYWADLQSWNPGVTINITGQIYCYLGISIWVNTSNAPYVLY